MMPNDVPLFASFLLSEQGRRFEHWEFDRHVGPGEECPPWLSPSMRTCMSILTKLRIDAIGYLAGKPWIFEVKPSVNLGAFGQVQGYEHFFVREVGVLPRKAIIAEEASRNLIVLAKQHDIELFLVQPATLAMIDAACRQLGLPPCSHLWAEDLISPPE